MIKQLKKYNVEYWIYRNDDYDSVHVEVSAISTNQAIKKAEKDAPTRAKNFKVIN